MTKLGDRSVAEVQRPTDKTGEGSNRTQSFTFFTKAQNITEILYNGDRLWAKVTVTLENAGPVAVGNQSSLTPVLSGKGVLLTTGEPMEFSIAKGTRLYIASTTINRVKVVVAPFPWLEQITATIISVAERIGSALAGGNSTPSDPTSSSKV